jgi:uncharacterized membrane protein YphA (DoxX/SURF4 family)
MERATVVKAARVIGMWAPAILLVIIFVPQGWSKFNNASGWATAFRHWGYPDWFRVTVGVMELSGVAWRCSSWDGRRPSGPSSSSP